ncbi:hypothetical protein C8J57DRAFT_1532486 [Mycena rebaudengoi]|nr:hypothetical protein C8J57DRAFT_1532486 [Mycena rebaudengoi]
MSSIVLDKEGHILLAYFSRCWIPNCPLPSLSSKPSERYKPLAHPSTADLLARAKLISQQYTGQTEADAATYSNRHFTYNRILEDTILHVYEASQYLATAHKPLPNERDIRHRPIDTFDPCPMPYTRSEVPTEVLVYSMIGIDSRDWLESHNLAFHYDLSPGLPLQELLNTGVRDMENSTSWFVFKTACFTEDIYTDVERGAGGVLPLQIRGADAEGVAVAFMEAIDDCGTMGNYTNLLVADRDFSLTGTGHAMGVGLQTEVMFTAMQKCTIPASAYLLPREDGFSTLCPLYSSSLVPVPESRLVDLK